MALVLLIYAKVRRIPKKVRRKIYPREVSPSTRREELQKHRIFPQHAEVSRCFESSDTASRNNGPAVGLDQHVIKLGSTEVKRSSVGRSRQMGMPDGQSGLLKLTPCKRAKSFGTCEIGNVPAGAFDIEDGSEVHIGHYAAL